MKKPDDYMSWLVGSNNISRDYNSQGMYFIGQGIQLIEEYRHYPTKNLIHETQQTIIPKLGNYDSKAPDSNSYKKIFQYCLFCICLPYDSISRTVGETLVYVLDL